MLGLGSAFVSVSHFCNMWKLSDFCIGWAQSIQCAVTKQTTALSRLYVHRPSPTMLTANRGQRWLSCRHYVTKKWFSYERNRQIQENVSYRLGSLFVTVRTLVHNRPPFSNPPMSCGTPCWPPNRRWLVAVVLQDYVGFHFAFFPKIFFLGGRCELGKVVEIDESCFSWLKCNCGRLRTRAFVFGGLSRSRGDLSCTCGWMLHRDIACHHEGVYLTWLHIPI
jgi:hypothetical protein